MDFEFYFYSYSYYLCIYLFITSGIIERKHNEQYKLEMTYRTLKNMKPRFQAVVKSNFKRIIYFTHFETFCNIVFFFFLFLQCNKYFFYETQRNKCTNK